MLIIIIILFFSLFRIDVCKDSEDDDFSDSGSSKTEGYAVLDVEYELASTSDDDTASSVSSGTDVSFVYQSYQLLFATYFYSIGIRNRSSNNSIL
jgi:hypothetical protein